MSADRLKEKPDLDAEKAEILTRKAPEEAEALLRDKLAEGDYSSETLAQDLEGLCDSSRWRAYQIMLEVVQHPDQVTALAFIERAPYIIVKDLGTTKNLGDGKTLVRKTAEPAESLPPAFSDARVTALFQYTIEQYGPELGQCLYEASLYKTEDTLTDSQDPKRIAAAEKKARINARIEAAYRSLVPEPANEG